MLTFKEYLQEAFLPTQINFGTDKEFSNHQFGNKNSIIYTFFEYKNISYLVYFDSQFHNLAFKSSPVKTFDFKNYTFEKTNNNSALRIFNFVIYIFIQILKKYKPSDFQFSAFNKDKTDPKLELFYQKLIESKDINKLLIDLGYMHARTLGKTHQFKKIDFVGNLKNLVKSKI